MLRGGARRLREVTYIYIDRHGLLAIAEATDSKLHSNCRYFAAQRIVLVLSERSDRSSSSSSIRPESESEDEDDFRPWPR